MNNYKLVFLSLTCLTWGMFGCEPSDSTSTQQNMEETSSQYPDSVYDYLAIPKDKPLSAASKRALERNYGQGPEWFAEFTMHELKGDLAYEEGVTRRDPSDIITVDGTYYVYYSKATGKTVGFGSGDPENKVFPWDKTEIWYATSKDGWTWDEQERVDARGEAGAYDDRSVFTPQIMVHDGKYVLVYQTVKAPYVNRVKNQVGMAIADSPDGPFEKLDAPILSPTDDGEWLGRRHPLCRKEARLV